MWHQFMVKVRVTVADKCQFILLADIMRGNNTQFLLMGRIATSDNIVKLNWSMIYRMQLYMSGICG